MWKKITVGVGLVTVVVAGTLSAGHWCESKIWAIPPLRIGMTQEQVDQLVGQPLGDLQSQRRSWRCWYHQRMDWFGTTRVIRVDFVDGIVTHWEIESILEQPAPNRPTRIVFFDRMLKFIGW